MMPEGALSEMLRKLFLKDGVAVIKFSEIRRSFSVLGKKYDMEGGKWAVPIFNNEKEVLMQLFMPKGSRYKSNMHPDCDETLVTITGKVIEKRSRLKRGPLGQLHWQAGTPHELDAIEESFMYALFKKVNP